MTNNDPVPNTLSATITNNNIKARTYSKLNLTPEEEKVLQQVWKKVFNKLNGIEIEDEEEKKPASSTGSFGRLSFKKMWKSSSQTSINELFLNKSGEELKSSLWSLTRSDHPDALLIRYIVARKWVIDDAVRMFLGSLEFFNTEPILKLQSEGERTINKEQLESGAFYFHQIDKDGYLTLYIHAAKSFPSNYTDDEQLAHTLNIITTSYLMLTKLGTITIVFNLMGFTMANLDINYMKTLIKLLTDKIPETLKRVIIHGAPWIFNSVWSVISSFLDPVIKSKVVFTNGEEIKEYIDETKLPAELGGSNPYKYKYIPPPEEEQLLPQDDTYAELIVTRQELTKEFELKTYKWIQGGEEADKLKAKRDELADQLAANHQALWPYTRCKNMYHRLGVINYYDNINWDAINTTASTITKNSD